MGSFDALGRPSSNDRNLRSPDGWSPRQPTVHDNRGARLSPFFLIGSPHETVNVETGSGRCLTAEVRGSNPLSSTRKSAQIDVIPRPQDSTQEFTSLTAPQIPSTAPEQGVLQQNRRKPDIEDNDAETAHADRQRRGLRADHVDHIGIPKSSCRIRLFLSEGMRHDFDTSSSYLALARSFFVPRGPRFSGHGDFKI